METDGIRAFCHTITQENEDGRDVYVRIRSGKGRSRATSIASGIKATGESPLSLAYDLERRYTQLAPTEPVWLEAVLEGTSKVIDVLKLPPAPEEPESTELDLHGGNAAVNTRLIDAIVDMSGDCNRRVGETQMMWLDAIRVQMQMWQELMKTKADLMIHETLDTNDNISEALAVLAPLVPALAGKIGGAKPKEGDSPPPDSDVDLNQATDSMIAGLVHIAENNPEMITPERVQQLVAVVK